MKNRKTFRFAQEFRTEIHGFHTTGHIFLCAYEENLYLCSVKTNYELKKKENYETLNSKTSKQKSNQTKKQLDNW